jgi:L-lactate dehydrogenase
MKGTPPVLFFNEKESKMENRKVAIIGDGQVGSSIAYTLLLGQAVNEIALIDLNPNKAEGDVLDMSDGMSFLSVPKVIKATSYEGVKGANIVIITAGAAQHEGETRLSLLGRNAAILTSVCAQLKPNLAPGAIVLVVSNPVDILTYFVYRKLGIPSSQVIGSGTVLDTSRLKSALAKDTGVDPRSIHALIVGEHGDSEVAVWSATSLGGMPLSKYCEKCGKCGSDASAHEARLNQLHEQVKNAAYEIIAKKGATFYAIALSVNRIVNAILNDENSVLTVSSYLSEGFEGEVKDLYLSLPCIVNSRGVKMVLEPDYSPVEKDALKKSALALKEKMADLPL